MLLWRKKPMSRASCGIPYLWFASVSWSVFFRHKGRELKLRPRQLRGERGTTHLFTLAHSLIMVFSCLVQRKTFTSFFAETMTLIRSGQAGKEKREGKVPIISSHRLSREEELENLIHDMLKTFLIYSIFTFSSN